jgi:hypothetical protein
MDILSRLVQKVSEDYMQPLSSRQLRHRISLYVDDAVIFLMLDTADINLVLDMLWLFRKASGLPTNVQKSSVVSIRCDDQILGTTKELPPSDFVDFPCKYFPVLLDYLEVYQLLDQVELQPGIPDTHIWSMDFKSSN